MELRRELVKLSDLACDVEYALEKARVMNGELFDFFDIEDGEQAMIEFPKRRTELWILSDYVLKAIESTSELVGRIEDMLDRKEKAA